jgi:hypothetical protein
MHRFFSLIIFPVLTAALALSACSGNEWRHPKKGLAELALDRAECRVLAENEAVSASLGKKRPVKSVLAASYAECMAVRGWNRRDAPGSPAISVPPVVPADDDSASGLGLTFRLPGGFTHAAGDSGHTGPTSWRRHAYSGPSGRSLVLVFQNSAAKIEKTEFPVPRGFHLYGRGYAGGLEWVAFSGERAGIPVACMGTYVPVAGPGRVVVTAAKPLPAGGDPPPSSNLVLNRAQRAAMESFIEEFSAWMSENPDYAAPEK